MTAKIATALRQQGHSVILAPTDGPNSAGEVARRQIATGADAILVAGGDGTVNETLNGVVGSGVPLGVLGGGTANVFVHEVGLSCNPEVNAARLSSLTPLRVALGVLRSGDDAPPRYFLDLAGAGLDARVVRHVSSELKSRFGKLAYYISGFSLSFARLSQFLARSNGQEWRCSFALASRVKNYGGDLEIASRASLLDDDFEVVLFEGETALRYFPYFAGVIMRSHDRLPGITRLKTRQLELLPLPNEDSVETQVDGELVGTLPATIEIAPDGLDVLVPQDFLRKAQPDDAVRQATPAA